MRSLLILLALPLVAWGGPISFDCPGPLHPTTAVVTATLPKECPDVAGDAVATVSDTAKGHIIKVTGACGCSVSDKCCECIGVGIYRGKCEHRQCVLEIKCDVLELPDPPKAKPPLPDLLKEQKPICTDSTCPPVLKLSDTASPLAVALAQLGTDSANYTATAGSLATAQVALAVATANVGSLSVAASTAQAAVSADLATIQQLIGPTPGPGPGPVGPTVALLEIGGTQCSACNALDPVLASMPTIPHTRVNIDADPTALPKWQPAYLPTLILTANGKEVTRYPNKATDTPLKWDAAQIKDWYQRTVQFVHDNPPK